MLKTLLKFTLAFTLIFWLYSSGKLDLKLVQMAFTKGPTWIFALLLIALQAFFATYRYKILLNTKLTNPISFLKLIPLNYIGLFFSSVLPGAVTGDIIKIVYVKKHDPSLSKTSLITITLLDRVLGLSGLLLLSGFFSLINYQKLTELSFKLKHLIHLNLFLCLCSMIFFSLLMSGRKVQKVINHFLYKVPLLGHRLVHIVESLLSLHENKKDLFSCLGLSILSQIAGISAFWVISSPFFSIPIPLSFSFSIIPIGLIATAIPISPGGLGVGHVLFANLFSLVNIHDGASLFNLFYLCSFAHNFTGILPYLLLGRKKNLA